MKEIPLGAIPWLFLKKINDFLAVVIGRRILNNVMKN
jgi:hypothetical protein